MLSSVEKIGDATVVQIPGSRLDASVADSFKESVRELISGGERQIVIDFTSIEFMDSSGLGALVGVMKVMGNGGSIEIANPNEAVMKVLRLTRMNKVFKIHDAPPKR